MGNLDWLVFITCLFWRRALRGPHCRQYMRAVPLPEKSRSVGDTGQRPLRSGGPDRPSSNPLPLALSLLLLRRAVPHRQHNMLLPAHPNATKIKTISVLLTQVRFRQEGQRIKIAPRSCQQKVVAVCRGRSVSNCWH